jgi:hypothetical protein
MLLRVFQRLLNIDVLALMSLSWMLITLSGYRHAFDI